MKFFLSLILFSLFWIFFPKLAVARDQVVTIVNPIRGSDFWSYNQKILDTPTKQYELIAKNNLPATWLVRFDALLDPQVVSFLSTLNNQQEVGLFLEITPSFASSAQVVYNQSGDWHRAKSIFLIGYNQADRQKLIDTAFEKYKQIFHHYPKSVGAWWVDAYSLSYMQQKYGIEANLDVADQASTDQYRVWGQYWSLPFYPSKMNALMPAESVEQKIGVVTIQWATRDPFNAYGNGTYDSTYSVQVNDYLLHDLDSKYFEKLLAIYPQVTVGLENDFNWEKFGQGSNEQLGLLASGANSGKFKVTTMSNFAALYKSVNPVVSPKELIVADDPLGQGGKVVWYQTPHYRIGWFYDPIFGSSIRDIRIYSSGATEGCYFVKCESLDLEAGKVGAFDQLNSHSPWVIDEGKISNIKVTSANNNIILSYTNQSQKTRTLTFLDNDIKIDDSVKTISGAILEASIRDKEITMPVIAKGVDLSPKIDWLNLLTGFGKFIVFSILFFAIPGLLVCRKWLLSIPVGWALFSLVSFILGWLHLDTLLWLIPLVSIGLLIKFKLPRLALPRFAAGQLALTTVILIGSFSWMMTVIKSGLLFGYGSGFWGPNGHDAIWHLALISELQRNFPPQNPIFAGTLLTNYHYFFDLLIARSGSLFQIDSQDLLFRFFPLFISLLSGLLFYSLVKKIFADQKAALFSTFFLYFAGSFGWIVSLFSNKTLGGESTFWSQQAVSTLLNPPFAISVVLLLGGLILFYEYVNQKKLLNYSLLIPIVLLFGTLIEFKAYAGVLILGSLSLFSVERFVFKKDLRPALVLFGVLVVALAVFLPNNSGSTSLFVFSPFWFVQTMVDFKDRLGWERLSLAIHAASTFKMILAYGIGTFVFFIGNFGTRIIALGEIKRFFRFTPLVYIALLGVIIPFLFIQTGSNWNSIQFFYYSLLMLSIFSGLSMAALWSKNFIVSKLLVIVIILLTIPTTYDTLSQYFPNRPPAQLPQDEVLGLKFLSTQPQGTVLTLPFNTMLRSHYTEPVPLLAYTSTGYVAAFSNHPTFLEDTINLDILGIDFKARSNEEHDLVTFKARAKSVLQDNKISYLYIPKIYSFELDEGALGVKKIFENSNLKIYKVI